MAIRVYLNMRETVKEQGMNAGNRIRIEQATPDVNKRWKRFRTILLSLIIVTATAAAVAVIRSNILEVHIYTVPAKASGKVRIVALSDLHGDMLGKDQERIVSEVKDIAPDFIFYLGDMIEGTCAEESVEPIVILTQRLAQIAHVYYVEGNHEGDVRNKEPEIYRKLNEELSNAGAIQLENETVQIKTDEGGLVNLCGITTHYYWENKENDIVADLRNREGINVLLCHYPESVLWYDAFDGGGLDLALCGHTHGGLIRVPFKGGMYAPEWGWWPMYDLGEYPIYSDTDWKHYGGGEGAEYWGTMIISGGLSGEHGVPRINNPMEISVVDIGK